MCVYIGVYVYVYVYVYIYIHIQFSKHHNLQHGLVHTLTLALENTEEISRRCLPRVFQSPPAPKQAMSYRLNTCELHPEAALPAFLLKTGESRINGKETFSYQNTDGAHCRRLWIKGRFKVTIPFPLTPPKSLKLKGHNLYITYYPSPWYI